MNDNRRIADHLETLIDQPEAYEGQLDPALEQVVNSLREVASNSQPRPGFLNELAQQLQEREKTMTVPRKQKVWQTGVRLLLGGIGVAAVFVFIFFVTGLFGQPQFEPAVSDIDTPEPSLTMEGTEGEFAGVEFQVLPELEEGPVEVALYGSQPQPVAATIEEAKALGTTLGMENPNVYRRGADDGSWVVTDDSGKKLTLKRAGDKVTGIFYSEGEQVEAKSGELIGLQAAKEIGEAFLNATGLLPQDYEVREFPQGTTQGIRMVRFTPLLDGKPVGGNGLLAQVGVLPDGRVAYAHLIPVTFQATGETNTVKSAKQALEELLNGDATYFYSYEPIGFWQDYQIYLPEQPPVEPGEEVTLRGSVEVLIGVENDEVKATLHAAPDNKRYKLSGAMVEELRNVNSGSIEATGIVQSVNDSSPNELKLQSWQRVAIVTDLFCRSGVLMREGNNSVLEMKDGKTYELAGSPDELESGQDVQVCAEDFTDGEVVQWHSMTKEPAGSMISIGSSGGVVAQSVEVTQVAPTITETGRIDGGTWSSTQSMAAPVQIAPIPEHELNESVVVTGTVQGMIVLQDGEREPRISLVVQTGGPLENKVYQYPLTGDPELLEELSQYYMLHVVISGVIVPTAEDAHGPEGQAIRVDSYTRPWPEQQIEALLGHFGVLMVDEREVTIFVDEESGQEYVMPGHHGEHDPQQKVWLSGVVHPTWQVAGRPVFLTHQRQIGDAVNKAESAGDIPLDTRMPEPELISSYDATYSHGLPGKIIIDRVVLGYATKDGIGSYWGHELRVTAVGDDGAASLSELLPIWLFYGQSEDGAKRFVFEVKAVQE